jgi:hypothetical protein
MLNLGPFLCLNVLNNSCSSLVDAYTDYANLVSPSLAMMFQHFLVVRHGLLAWRAPGGPEINEHHLSCFMINALLLLLVDIVDLSYGNEWTSDCELD